ncbi:hypothetical protein BD410DRAFT_843587 [Rickenella mellea]|uniref:Uncharacterized protein n=1 Tax=Rickenella mellea TaxID=50990 RepID=A0A4Y7PSE9_9AGAM|nr:hypothetical protein BD410DRAFT_843587 [Rickenella mellea]
MVYDDDDEQKTKSDDGVPLYRRQVGIQTSVIEGKFQASKCSKPPLTLGAKDRAAFVAEPGTRMGRWSNLMLLVCPKEHNTLKPRMDNATSNNLTPPAARCQ